MKSYLLTTIDNPYHPIDQLEDWLRTDRELAIANNRPETNSLIDTFAGTSYNLTNAINQRAINQAIDDIIRLDEQGIYKRIIVED